MTMSIPHSANHRDPVQFHARLAGFLYLFVMLTFMAGMRHIGSSEALYRAALVSQLVSAVATVLLGGALYAVLKTVDANLALFALLWRVAEATLGGVCVLIRCVALENDLGSVEAPQAWARLLLAAGYRTCFYTSIVFFSVGSAVFFALLFRSRGVPRPLAALGVLASVLAGLLGLAYLMAPKAVLALGFIGWLPIFAAEVGTGLWLLVKGVDLGARERKPAAMA